MQSLITIGSLEKGQSVLIHSACGGVGLAAVQLARVIEAEIYTTVVSEEKVQYLMTTFNIPRERIFNSRDASSPRVDAGDAQQGCRLVLNSISGELLHATWHCLASSGRMVEIGKRDLLGFGQLEMNLFLANRSYSCVDMDAFRYMQRGQHIGRICVRIRENPERTSRIMCA
ncbi:MAG: hypothetical protein Q9178_004449 [Gyalolechia marmorata]